MCVGLGVFRGSLGAQERGERAEFSFFAENSSTVVASLTFLWGVSSSRVGVEADSSVGCISKGR